jgi:predicted transcriptional regulator
MSRNAVITARVSETMLADLDKLAGYHDRSRAWLVAQAVERYVSEESAFLSFVREGEDAIVAGDFVTHDQLVAEQLIWSGPARRDLLAIVEYYSVIDPDLPNQLLDRVRNAPLMLLDHPEIGAPTVLRSVRKWPVAGTPFLLFYSAGRERVEIKRVRHAATNWRDA